jgi:hypothetical protein
MRIRLAVPVHTLALALLATFIIPARAQPSLSKLILRAESLKPILQPGMLAQDSVTKERLHIEILKGDHGVNVLNTKTAVKPIVEVRDRNDLPVGGVAVTFTAPNDGPSVLFLNGSRSITLMSDPTGQIVVQGIEPVNPGRFQIAVSASLESETVVTAISLTNLLTEHATATGAKKSGLSKGVIFALVGAGAAAAVGIGVGLGGHSSSGSSGGGSSSSAPSASIGLGSGGATAGTPH